MSNKPGMYIYMLGYFLLELPSERYGSPIYLTLEDVQKLYTADLSDDPYLAVQRDIFVFQCNVK